MKKFFLIIALLSSVLFADVLPSFDVPETSKKTYSELIPFLENADKGNYYLVLAVFYGNGVFVKDDAGKTIQKDISKSVMYFNKAIEKDDKNAPVIYAEYLLHNKDFMVVKNNIKTAKSVLQKSLKSGTSEASILLSEIYFKYENDNKKGLSTLTYGAKLGNSSAQLLLANIFHFGSVENGVSVIEKNDAIANEFLTQACTNKIQTQSVKEFCSKYAEKYQK